MTAVRRLGRPATWTPRCCTPHVPWRCRTTTCWLLELVVTEVWRGAPLTFCTADAQALLAELDRVATVVPVTTRTRAQYVRVRLLESPTYAVVANGGHLLVDGRPDEDWARQVRARLAQCRPLPEVVEALRRATDGHRAGDCAGSTSCSPTSPSTARRCRRAR